jgi:hypothetical protein
MAYTGNSIVDYLKSIGQDGSYSARAKKAAEMGIKNYAGTAEQNTQMLNVLKNAASNAPAATTSTTNITPLNTSPATPAADPDRELAKQYASGAINLDQLNTGMNTIRGRTTTPDISGISNLNMAPAAPAPSYESPWEGKINAALDKLLGLNMNAPYDVTTSSQYAPLKMQYEQAGQSAFNNQIGGLSALTGGRPSTAAVGTATAAQNEYAQDFAGTVVPSLVSAEQTRRQNEYNNILGQLETLQGLEAGTYSKYRDTVADTQAAEEKKVSDFLSTIGQYSDNYKLETNRIEANIAKGDTSEQWKLPYLNTARQEKIGNMQAAQAEAEAKAAEEKTEAEQRQYEKEMKLWTTEGTASRDYPAIGVNKGAKTADYNIDSINAQTSRMNAETSRANAAKADADKRILTNTQIFNLVKEKANEQVSTGKLDNKGNPVTRPKYTKEEFDVWLDQLVPDDDELRVIMDAIDYDNLKFYVPVLPDIPKQSEHR